MFIVDRNRLRLHQSLVEMFAAEEDIQVIFDRRVADRRRRAETTTMERRRGERRGHPEVEEQLRVRGYAKVLW